MQSANIDPTTAGHKITLVEVAKLYKNMGITPSNNTYLEMVHLSNELSELNGVTYLHDLYQVAVAASIPFFNEKFTILTLPTSSGKTFIIGLLYQYYKSH